MSKIPFITLLISLLFAIACKNEGVETSNNTNTNNSTSGNYGLNFHAPSTGELNLLSGESATISVTLTTAIGTPAVSEPVDFMIQGQAGGSSLSEATVMTNAEGTAEIEVHGGTTAAHFEINVSHALAAPLSFDVTVSESGLASFHLTFDYQGPQEDLFDHMEVGLLFGTTCDSTELLTLDLSRLRELSSLAEILSYENLPVDVPFTFTARMYTEDSTLLGYGCLTPEEEHLTAGSNVNLTITLQDYMLSLDGTSLLMGETDASTLSPHITEKLEGWYDLGRCTYGLPMGYLNCLVSYLEQGDPSTCGRGVSTPLSEAIMDMRGILDGQGCRGSLNSHGGASLEASLQNISPDLAALQAALTSMRQFLELEPFETMSVGFVLAQDANGYTLTPSTIEFTLMGNSAYTPVNPWNDQAPMELDYTGLTPSYTLAPTSTTLGLVPLVLQILSDQFFAPNSTRLSAPLFVARMQEIIQEESNTTWQQKLRDLLSAELTDLELERAFSLLAGLMAIEEGDPHGADLLVEGSMLFLDENRDQVVETTTTDLSLEVDPSGQTGW